ncbi:hypothetical protein C8R43DRAFT_1231828 [Mycena crocata]|nr:hypothetical protein C8R43DRAFT_1231828 [Mycena crocata]
MALPTELIGHIFACTHAELIDAIRLGLTCQRIPLLGRRPHHLRRRRDPPSQPALARLSEQEIFDFFRPPPTTLFSYPYSTPPRESTFSAMLVAAVEGKLAPRDRYLFESLVRVNASWADERPPQVLRNLSRRVYVTESKVRWAYPTGATGLGELLLSRICRSSVGSADVPHPGLHRGVWAGDRFDIVSEVQWMSQLMKLAGNADPWLDVSEEVLTEYDAISACRRR